jgi:hypothetical protein
MVVIGKKDHLPPLYVHMSYCLETSIIVYRSIILG